MIKHGNEYIFKQNFHKLTNEINKIKIFKM